MDNIIVDIDFVLDDFNPSILARRIADRVRTRRLALNLTQQALAKRSGVTLGTLKRFESRFEISLKHLLMIAVVLEETEAFEALFTKRQYSSIDEVLNERSAKERKRGRKNG